MRQRMIKPEFWSDAKIGKLSFASRLAYIASWNIADDLGRLPGEPVWLRGQIFPYDPNVDMMKIKTELVANGRWVSYRVAGEEYIAIPHFLRHQSIEKPSRWSYPEPDFIGEEPAKQSGSSRGVVGEQSPLKGKEGKQKRREVKQKEELRARRGAAPKTEPEAAPLLPPPPPEYKHELLRDIWNCAMRATPIPLCAAWTSELDSLAAERAAQNPGLSPADWRRAFLAVSGSPFLRGEINGHDGTPFTGATGGGLKWFLTGPMHLKKALAGESPYARPAAAVLEPSAARMPPPVIRPDFEAAALWRQVQGVLSEEIDAENFEAWIAPTHGLSLIGDAFEIAVESAVARNWLSSHYMTAIAKALCEAAGQVLVPTFTIATIPELEATA